MNERQKLRGVQKKLKSSEMGLGMLEKKLWIYANFIYNILSRNFKI